MVRRLLILQLLLLGGLGSVFLLPKAPPMQASALVVNAQDHPDLPNQLIMSGWSGGNRIKPAEKELAALADDTNFARRNYFRPVPGSLDRSLTQTLQASIVLSGKDLNNSIHRPERCLPAQGMNIESGTLMKVPLRSGKALTLKKLHCSATDAATGTPYVYLNYYWFVGHDSLQYSHYGRTLKDMKDRLIQGYDQRWAYITVSLSLISVPGVNEMGQRVNMVAPTEEEADRLVSEFVSELAPEIIQLDTIREWD